MTSKINLSPFHTAVNTFVEDVEGLRTSFPIVLRSMQRNESKSRKSFYTALNIDFDKPFPQKDPYTHSYHDFQRKSRIHFQFTRATELIPRAFMVSLISQYDAFLGQLIRGVFEIKPELLNVSDRQFSFSDLAAFESIDDAKWYVIEKEIESVLRKSHREQFEWLESKLSMGTSGLRKELDSWPVFVEVTERRNLYVHNDGRVSTHYIETCNKHGIDTKKIKPGDGLCIDQEYFKCASSCIFEIGVKLAHVIWRKLQPNHTDSADENFGEIAFQLIVSEDFSLAIKLLEFFLSTPAFTKKSSESHNLNCKLNLAQSYKWHGNESKCQAILEEIDWSAKAPIYLLGRDVLTDEFEMAAKSMSLIGKDLWYRDAYSDWPIFGKFRNSEPFLNMYESIYNQSFHEYEQLKAGKAEEQMKKGWWKGKGKRGKRKVIRKEQQVKSDTEPA